jgi:hypothetical protein
LRALLASSEFVTLVSSWPLAYDRHLVVDELLELLKKLKITIRKDQVKRMRDIADKGKK